MSNSVNDSMKKMADRAITVGEGGDGSGVLVRSNAEQNKFDSVSGYGNATAPAANAAIATIASGSLPSGYYKVAVEASIDAGAPAAGDRDNMELRAGAAVLKRIVVNPVTSPMTGFIREFFINLNGSTALTVNANGAGTASVVYRASITATRVS